MWINLQGKDRIDQINRYKELCEKKHIEYKKPASVKAELKMHMTYEGWKKDDKRHSLVNKRYLVGFMSAKEIKKKRDAKIYQEYDVKKIQVRAINGDNASWITSLATKNIIRQLDNYHIHQEIIRDIPIEQDRRQIERIIAESRYQEIPVYLEYLKNEYGGEEKDVKKLERLEKYLSEGLERYQEVIQKQGMKIPEPPEGIEYRDMGIMESQIFTVLSKRFKSGRLNFSKFGATCLAKICAIKVEKGEINLQEINQEIPIDNSIQEYLKQIQENIKKGKNVLKINNSDTKIEYKKINIDSKNPIIAELAMTPISELDYII